MTKILGLHGRHYSTARPLTDSATILSISPKSGPVTLVLQVQAVGKPEEVTTQFGDTVHVRVVFVGEDDKLTVPGHAFGKNADKVQDFLPIGARIVMKTSPVDPEKDLFGSEAKFSLRLNTDTRISCAGLIPYDDTPQDHAIVSESDIIHDDE
uniref:DnaJ_C domain-containing protein n=1 Tax=Panagrellus redivivus TaxID=6233 RepID=A0A7E4V946_PANRE